VHDSALGSGAAQGGDVGQLASKYVYDFAEGNKDLKDLLGGKGANLAEMTNLGLPVPPGFTITTEACKEYLKTRRLDDGLADEVEQHLQRLQATMGRRLGDPADPLLVSVRSGAKFSMPGRMDTVLNVGLNDDSVLGPIRQAGGDAAAERFGWDSYRRLIQMYGKPCATSGEALHALMRPSGSEHHRRPAPGRGRPEARGRVQEGRPAHRP
jgi:pyruvate,orthophosphate dikinase